LERQVFSFLFLLFCLMKKKHFFSFLSFSPVPTHTQQTPRSYKRKMREEKEGAKKRKRKKKKKLSSLHRSSHHHPSGLMIWRFPFPLPLGLRKENIYLSIYLSIYLPIWQGEELLLGDKGRERGKKEEAKSTSSYSSILGSPAGSLFSLFFFQFHPHCSASPMWSRTSISSPPEEEKLKGAPPARVAVGEQLPIGSIPGMTIPAGSSLILTLPSKKGSSQFPLPKRRNGVRKKMRGTRPGWVWEWRLGIGRARGGVLLQ